MHLIPDIKITLADDCLWGCHAPSDYPSRFPTVFFTEVKCFFVQGFV